jgi:DNA repair photolyase
VQCKEAGVKFKRIDNPPNPFLSEQRDWLEPPRTRIEVYEETSGSILSHNTSPDVPFAWSVNPYRGCQHACAYCYARTYHEYLGLGAGTDFDTKLVVKPNAPELLRKAFGKPSWKHEHVNFSGITDCYQPIEASYRLTRKCLQVCAECCNPASVTIKGFLVVRDIDILSNLNARAGVSVTFSIPFADAAIARLIEPQAPPPERQLEAMRRLHEAGIPVGVIVSPIIPGLNDRDIPRILEKAAAAGARSASYTALRLPGSVQDVFIKRLREVMPLRADHVMNLLNEVRGGRLDEARFGKRMRGQGTYWDSICDMFRVFKMQFGFGAHATPEANPTACETPCLPDDPQLEFRFHSMTDS